VLFLFTALAWKKCAIPPFKDDMLRIKVLSDATTAADESVCRLVNNCTKFLYPGVIFSIFSDCKDEENFKYLILTPLTFLLKSAKT